jgi:hypothetical protein
MVALLIGAAGAIERRWICDDAFISYRYAQNLLDGHGLVFNKGEYVEGYTNFLWTLWCAAGMALGFKPEMWSIFWGIAFYLICLGILARPTAKDHKTPSPFSAFIPVAALLGALHQDWTIFATSGLETSAFTCSAVLAYSLVCDNRSISFRRSAIVGILLGLAGLTRPEGVLFAAVIGVFIAIHASEKMRAATGFLLAFAAIYLPFLFWRRWYYGDWLPNTYYAKSGHLAWWAQGWQYLLIYLEKYFVLAIGLIGCICIWIRPFARWLSPDSIHVRRRFTLAAAMGLIYTLYVTRIGGDFMYARMLIPATPFFLIMIEETLRALTGRRAMLYLVLVIAIACGLVLPDFPVKDHGLHYGIANEWEFFGKTLMSEQEDPTSAILRKYFDGLDARVAFLGVEAHRMYRAKIAYAIESEAGLTDRFVARQVLTSRGRVGHEKHAPIDYLIRRRRVQLTFSYAAASLLELAPSIPIWPITLDGFPGLVLHWDATLIAELRRRGAVVEDFPAEVDRVINRLDTLSDEDVKSIYAKFRLFYFEHVQDSARESAFTRRLGDASRVPSTT